jgi:hypothetical protein
MDTWMQRFKKNPERVRYLDYRSWERHGRFVNGHCTNLDSFKDLPRHEQGVMLLKRLAVLFGKQTFDPQQVPVEIGACVNSDGLAFGFPPSELRDAHLYLLTDPWSEIACAGYVAEAPLGSGMYEITAKGWVEVESKPVKVDNDVLPL